MTSLYGVMRGRPPRFFDGNPQVFAGLRFHLDEQAFAFYQPVKMRDDPLWVDVTELMKKGTAGLGDLVAKTKADFQTEQAFGASLVATVISRAAFLAAGWVEKRVRERYT